MLFSAVRKNGVLQIVMLAQKKRARRSFISTLSEAKTVLGLVSSDSLSMKELRNFYFVAAKACHPDTKGDNAAAGDDDDGHARFIRLTEAYEFIQKTLLQTGAASDVATVDISASEDSIFRVACQEELGLAAETVEECKQNPGFRQWLQGNTDAAHLWRNFFMLHGGLAPRLRPLPMLGHGSTQRLVQRRPKRR